MFLGSHRIPVRPGTSLFFGGQKGYGSGEAKVKRGEVKKPRPQRWKGQGRGIWRWVHLAARSVPKLRFREVVGSSARALDTHHGVWYLAGSVAKNIWKW